jgi:carbon monoxide dehydrogenase subunit G
MIFSAREDVDVPIDNAFAMLSDFDTYERIALRRGIEVERQDMLHLPGEGMQWGVQFEYRGKLRDVVLKLVRYEAPNTMHFRVDGQGLGGRMDIELVAMSRSRTRLSIEVELEAHTLSARLLVQSMKLARTKLNKGFHTRIANLALELQERYRNAS